MRNIFFLLFLVLVAASFTTPAAANMTPAQQRCAAAFEQATGHSVVGIAHASYRRLTHDDVEKLFRSIGTRNGHTVIMSDISKTDNHTSGFSRARHTLVTILDGEEIVGYRGYIWLPGEGGVFGGGTAHFNGGCGTAFVVHPNTRFFPVSTS